MAVETTLRIGLTDVQRLTFECQKCKSVLGLAPARWFGTQHECPHCHEMWINTPDVQDAAHGIITGLKYLLDHEAGLPFALRFEARSRETE